MFNRIFLTTCLTLSLANAADEFSSERLLGIEVGYTGMAMNNAIGVGEKRSLVEGGVRIGAQNTDWRTLISVGMTKDSDFTTQKAMISFDRFVWQSLYKKDHVMFKPYLGAHVGWIEHIENNIDENGMFYGAGLGLTWTVLDEIDFDFGYKYSVSNLENLKNFDALTFGINYIY